MENTLTTILSEIGLTQDEISVAEGLNKSGKTDDLQKYLRICRCDLMDEIHSSQRKVDSLDYFIRQIKGGAL